MRRPLDPASIPAPSGSSRDSPSLHPRLILLLPLIIILLYFHQSVAISVTREGFLFLSLSESAISRRLSVSIVDFRRNPPFYSFEMSQFAPIKLA